jgi:hypothetical protein
MAINRALVFHAAWADNHGTASQDNVSIEEGDRHQEQRHLEMFHAVLLHNDMQAKAQFQQQLNATVVRWIRLHPRRERAYQYEKEEYYVTQAFACFWRVTAQQHVGTFGTFAAVLQFLQASVNSVVLEAVRTAKRPKVSLAARHEMGDGDEMWEHVQCLFSDARERRIAYLLVHCGMKPKEIVQFYPDEFGDVSEIVSIRLAIFNGGIIHCA